ISGEIIQIDAGHCRKLCPRHVLDDPGDASRPTVQECRVMEAHRCVHCVTHLPQDAPGQKTFRLMAVLVHRVYNKKTRNHRTGREIVEFVEPGIF
ncbi:unnamed protein product, partial [Heterotrigona itama]